MNELDEFGAAFDRYWKSGATIVPPDLKSKFQALVEKGWLEKDGTPGHRMKSGDSPWNGTASPQASRLLTGNPLAQGESPDSIGDQNG